MTKFSITALGSPDQKQKMMVDLEKYLNDRATTPDENAINLSKNIETFCEGEGYIFNYIMPFKFQITIERQGILL